MENLKRCSGCHQVLPATMAYFHRNVKSPDGLHNECKTCRRERAIDYAHGDRDRRLTWQRHWVRRLRLRALRHYSGGDPKCACCGEAHHEFLVLDHSNGGGAQHQQEVGGGSNIYRWLLKHQCPDGFRVLCQNCNASLGAWGYCPHQREAEKAGEAG